MRVKKICTGRCGKLKNMYDFLPSEEFADKKTTECKSCIEEKQFGENNSTINNNNNHLKLNTMPTLKEKREAEAAAKAANQGTPAAAPAAEKPKTDTPKPAAPKPTPKVGDTTKDGLKVVGEKKESDGKRGRKAPAEKVIEQLDMEGKPTGLKFNTLQEAADAVGKNKAYVLDGLRGWAKSVAGFKWRYEGEEIFVREKKVKTAAEKEFVGESPAGDIPVPGDLDYDPELHAPKAEVVEEDILDAPEEETGEQVAE